MRLARGSRKGASKTEKMAAQEEMGALGNARALMSIIQARVGDADLSQLGYLQKESLTKFGVSKDQIEIFAQLQETFKGQLKEAQRIASLDISEDEKNKQLAKLNAGVKMKGGKLVSGDTESEITGYGDFFQAQADVVQDALDKGEANQMTSEQFLAEGVEATTSVFNVLNNTIAGILNDISGGIYKVVGYFFSSKGEEDETKAAKRELANELEAELALIDRNRADQEKEKQALQKDIASASLDQSKSGKGKLKTAKQRLADLEKEMERDKSLQAARKEQMRILQGTTYGGEEYSVEQLRRMSAEETVAKRARRGVKDDVVSKRSGRFAQMEEQDLADIADIIEKHTGRRDLEGAMRMIMGEYDRQVRGTETRDRSDLTKVQNVLAQKGYQIKTKSSSKSYGKAGSKRKTEYSLRKGIKGEDGRVVDTEVAGGETESMMSSKGIKNSYDKFSTRVSEDVAKLLQEPKPRKNVREEAVEAEKAVRKQQIENQTEAVMKGMQEYEDKDKLANLKAVAKTLGLKTGDQSTVESLSKRIAKVDYKSLSERQKQGLSSQALSGNQVARSFVQSAEDILITNDGQVWKLNERDRMTSMGGGSYAMSKPGGAIDEYVGKRMGGMGGISINVNGAQNPEEVGRVVMRKIKEYQASFMGSVK